MMFLSRAWMPCASVFVLVACGSTPNRQPAATSRRPTTTVQSAPEAPARVEPAALRPESIPQDAGDLQSPIGSGAASALATDQSGVGAPTLGGDLLGTVAGSPLYASELLQAWLHRDSREVSRYLDKLVMDRLVIAESKRLGVVLDRELVQEAIAQSRQQLGDEITKAGGSSMEEFIEVRLGLDSATYLARLESATVTDLLTERCLRAFFLENDRVAVRMIVVKEKDQADLVQAAIARGEDFAGLAQTHSIDPSNESGGVIPPVVRSQASISRLAFTTEVGEVGGPLFERGRWIFLLVEERLPARSGGWEVLGPAIEASLADRPLDELEFLQWQASLTSRYEVDTTAFLRLVGEPTQSNP